MNMSKQQDLLYQKIRSHVGRVKVIENYRPNWLRNPKTGRNLEIDLYLPKFKIGIEYQGAQHFKHVYNMDRNIDYTRYKDTLKIELAKKRKVNIVEIFEQDLNHKPFGEIFYERIMQQCKPKQANIIVEKIERKRKSDIETMKIREKIKEFDKEFDSIINVT